MEGYQAVVGIDLGTSATGFAFSFIDVPEHIHDGDLSGNPHYHKTPTVLWTWNDGDFRAFGLDAVEGYAQDLYNDRELSNLFSKFKLLLVDADSDPLITLANGNSTPLSQVMTMTLVHVKEKALIKLSHVLGNLLIQDGVLWVITVPTMWSDYSKQFMRQCAYQAGLIQNEGSDRLILALEPEAAVASCLNDVNPILHLRNGTKFIMLDCGGGTVDVTCHVVASGGVDDAQDVLCLNELLSPQGGAYGSIKVDENFLNLFMKPLLGHTLYDKLDHLPSCKHLLMEEFEGKVKKKHGPRVKSARLNFSHIEEVFEGEDICLSDLIDEFNSKQASEKTVELYGRCTVKLSHALICSLFDPIIEEILSILSPLLLEDPLLGLRHVFLVGGFGESCYLQHRLNALLQPMNISLTLPPCPGKAVMLGAVRFGLFPELFSSRISKYTYGVSAVIDGVSKQFDKFVTMGQEVPYGLRVTRQYKPLTDTQQWISVEMYQSIDSCDTISTKDAFLLANLRIKVPMHVAFADREVNVSMCFGSTEISAQASIGGVLIESTLTFNQPSSTPLKTEAKHGDSEEPSCRSVHFLLDVSTSMNCSSRGRMRLEDAKLGIFHVIENVLVPLPQVEEDVSLNRMALSTFSTQFESIFSEVGVGLAPVEALGELEAEGSTCFYSSCVDQLKIMQRLFENETANSTVKRFLLVFTDGVDDSRHSYHQDPGFIELLHMLNDDKGVCSQLAGFIIISIGLNELALKPLEILKEASNKLLLISFEQVSQIENAFGVASEEIEKLC